MIDDSDTSALWITVHFDWNRLRMAWLPRLASHGLASYGLASLSWLTLSYYAAHQRQQRAISANVICSAITWLSPLGKGGKVAERRGEGERAE